MIKYIGDTHLGHANVIKFDDRPFDTVEEMDEYIISAWNANVTDKDDVYIDGDLVFKSSKESYKYVERLKGKLHLIEGNHDTALLKDKRAMQRFESVDKLVDIVDERRRVVICHYPIIEWNGYFRGSYHVYAHIHNNFNNAYKVMRNEEKALNCGCMINNYMPVTLDQLIENNKLFKENHNEV